VVDRPLSLGLAGVSCGLDDGVVVESGQAVGAWVLSGVQLGDAGERAFVAIAGGEFAVGVGVDDLL
jgi:hypothetical protein